MRPVGAVGFAVGLCPPFRVSPNPVGSVGFPWGGGEGLHLWGLSKSRGGCGVPLGALHPTGVSLSPQEVVGFALGLCTPIGSLQTQWEFPWGALHPFEVPLSPVGAVGFTLGLYTPLGSP